MISVAAALALIFFGLGYRLRDLVIQAAYENHLNTHSARSVTPGCIFCGVERPQEARDVVHRIEYGPETVHELSYPDDLESIASDLRRQLWRIRTCQCDGNCPHHEGESCHDTAFTTVLHAGADEPTPMCLTCATRFVNE